MLNFNKKKYVSFDNLTKFSGMIQKALSDKLKNVETNLNEKIDSRFKSLTAKEQGDSEVIDARKGEASLRAKIDVIDEDIKNVSSQLEQIKKNVIYVSSYNSNTNLQRIINECDGTLVFERNKIYNIDYTLKLKPNVLYDFNNCTIKYSGNGICIDTSDNVGSNFYIKNLNIEMTENNTSQIGLNIFNCGKSLFENIFIKYGGYGIKSINSWSYTMKDIKMHNVKHCGYYHQGDGGCEIYGENIYIGYSGDFKGKYGVEIERTTSEDRGGYYFKDLLVVANVPSGASLEQGIYIHSSSETPAITVFNMVGGGSDGFNINKANNGYFAIKLDNVSAIRITNTWTMSIGYYNKCDNVIISDTNLAYGNFFKTAMAVYNLMVSNCSVAENTCFNYDNNSSTGAIYYNNIRTSTLTNNYKLLNQNRNILENTHYTSSTSPNSVLKMAYDEDISKSYKFTLNNLEQFVITSPSDKKIQIASSGGLRLPSGGYVTINENKVLGETVSGWSTPTGKSKRDGFDTATVSTQGLAETVRALIEDLKKHGLISF